MTSPAERVFATPELFENIFKFVLAQMLGVTKQENPRSVKTHVNARILMQILRCSRVNRSWQRCMLGSHLLQKSLFLTTYPNMGRKWEREQGSLAPMLNPIIQDTFPKYGFCLCADTTIGNQTSERYAAIMIINKRDLLCTQMKSSTRQGRNISAMFLTQPPCTTMEASLWLERVDRTDFFGRPFSVKDSAIKCEDGLTLGYVHQRVKEIFAEHPDAPAIRLMTI